MSSQVDHKLYLVREAVRGTTPPNPALISIRHTGTTLALTKDSFKSAEIAADRNLKDFRHGNHNVSGDISFELSYGNFEHILESLLMGTFAASKLTVGNTRRSYSAVRNFSDQAGGDKPFHIFTGIEFDKFSLKIVAGKIVTASVSVIGKGVSYNATAPAGSAFIPALETSVMDGFTGSATIDGIGGNMTEIALNIENALSPNFVLFSNQSTLPSKDTCMISGEIGVRFDNSLMLEKFLAEEFVPIVITLTDNAEDPNSLIITLPKVSLTGGQPDIAGAGQVALKIPFQAVYDPVTEVAIEIEASGYVVPLVSAGIVPLAP